MRGNKFSALALLLSVAGVTALASGVGCVEESPALGTIGQALTWQQCSAGGGTDYTGDNGHSGSECRGACGANCDGDSCSDWSPCTNGTQFRTCYTTAFCQAHDKCYDCCHDNGMSTDFGSQCGAGCDANCLYQYHPPCGPQVCTWVCDASYGGGGYGGSGYGSNGSPTCVTMHQVCTPDPNDPPNCGKQYTESECAELAFGYTNDFPEATSIQFDRSCQDCVPDGSCSAPPCGVGVDNCGNGCARTDGCGGGSGYGGSTYGY
jgi:hypothetical protein